MNYKEKNKYVELIFLFLFVIILLADGTLPSDKRYDFWVELSPQVNGSIQSYMFFYDFNYNTGYLDFYLERDMDIHVIIEYPEELDVVDNIFCLYGSDNTDEIKNVKYDSNRIRFDIVNDFKCNHIVINFTSLDTNFYPNGQFFFVGEARTVHGKDMDEYGFYDYYGWAQFNLGKYKCSDMCFEGIRNAEHRKIDDLIFILSNRTSISPVGFRLNTYDASASFVKGFLNDMSVG